MHLSVVLENQTDTPIPLLLTRNMTKQQLGLSAISLLVKEKRWQLFQNKVHTTVHPNNQ
jgi:hypothetical protein